MGLEAARMLGEGMAMDRVQRWDVYDIADELADVPGMISRVVRGETLFGETLDEVYSLLAELENRLWAAAERGGRVGPYPEYQTIKEV